MFIVNVKYSIDNKQEKVKNFAFNFGKHVLLISLAQTKWYRKGKENKFIWMSKNSIFIDRLAFRIFNKKGDK